MEANKCPKCGKNTLIEIPQLGSKIYGKAMQCKNPVCDYFNNPMVGKKLGDLLDNDDKIVNK